MSTIIKAATGEMNASGVDVQGVAFQLDDIAGQAKWYLDSVRRQAERILQQAHKDAETIRANAEKEGRQAAMSAVGKVLEDKVAAQMATILPALQKSVESIEHSRAAWLKHWRASAVHVAAEIAARLIRRELKSEPAIALDLVAEALELAAGGGEITVRMNPEDHQRLGNQAEELVARLRSLGPAKVIPDERVSPGGCQVETRFGRIDQTFEAQLARIEEELA
jgi:flagellar assembly protein FliH